MISQHNARTQTVCSLVYKFGYYGVTQFTYNKGTWLTYDITKNSVIFRVAIIELCSEAIHLNTPKYKMT